MHILLYVLLEQKHVESCFFKFDACHQTCYPKDVATTSPNQNKKKNYLYLLFAMKCHSICLHHYLCWLFSSQVWTMNPCPSTITQTQIQWLQNFQHMQLLKWHFSWLYSTHANDMYVYHKRVEVANICKVGMDLWSLAHFYLQINVVMLKTLTMLCCVKSFTTMLFMKELLLIQHYPYPSFWQTRCYCALVPCHFVPMVIKDLNMCVKAVG